LVGPDEEQHDIRSNRNRVERAIHDDLRLALKYRDERDVFRTDVLELAENAQCILQVRLYALGLHHVMRVDADCTKFVVSRYSCEHALRSLLPEPAPCRDEPRICRYACRDCIGERHANRAL
jgi:hypothetical protein